MKIIVMTTSGYGTNCYIVFSEKTKKGIIVDPGGEASRILDIVEENNIDVQSIILTHGHGDHIGGVEEVKSALNIPVLAHKDEVELLGDGGLNYSSSMSFGAIEMKADVLLVDGEEIDYDGFKVKVIHTPGHTEGGISLIIGNVIISGDTLFAGSIGRTDFPGGDYNTIIESIKEKLLVYPDDYQVLPGHGPATTILKERKTNPFLI